MNDQLINEIRQRLIEQADEHTRSTSQSFFKEKVVYYGVKTAVVSQIARQYFKKIGPSGKNAVLCACEKLFKSGYIEESFIACEWAYLVHKEYEPADIRVFENWIGKYVSNWATCDTLCNHAVGTFIERYPEYVVNLKEWTRSENRWFRRAAAVTLILPARHGMFLNDIFEIAGSLLTDTDDLVQKGYGWMLKEASKPHLPEVFEYIMRNKKSMPRTALRYAIEKMPADLKRQAMAK
jgi:3-methyladenine DNA glycosylase AlkD